MEVELWPITQCLYNLAYLICAHSGISQYANIIHILRVRKLIGCLIQLWHKLIFCFNARGINEHVQNITIPLFTKSTIPHPPTLLPKPRNARETPQKHSRGLI